jgi:UDP-2-acetamido-2,6-beta-L-arabino-hexul-4-ose reductase
MKKIVITGGSGLLGRHSSIRLHAFNCAEIYAGRPQPYVVERLNHEDFQNKSRLEAAVENADVILHFAGMNRGPSEEIEQKNPEIANVLIDACRKVSSKPHIVYANSTHYSSDTSYGRSKKKAHEILSNYTSNYTNLILPHIFGEGARSDYNNVTATFIDRVIKEQVPEVNPEGRVELLHAGSVANSAIKAAIDGKAGDLRLVGNLMSVQNLLSLIYSFHKSYSNNVYPDLLESFHVELFNTYRSKLYPDQFPKNLNVHTDERGNLFEAVKGGCAGQIFLSWTKPKVTRGNHFHLKKIERFLVLEGEAIIRIRPVFEDNVWEYKVTGDKPAIIDMPTLHTHSIENTGSKPLLTLFWTNEVFDPTNPDTYADTVLKG